MTSKKNDKKTLENFLLKINPELRKNLNNTKIDLIDDGIIDSFDIIQIISMIEKLSGKKINPKKIKRESFSNLKNMLKLI
tara:strand:+ start:66 stop:305 length:240 start_codon:yes stop_codon:yes gene_type:complete